MHFLYIFVLVDIIHMLIVYGCFVVETVKQIYRYFIDPVREIVVLLQHNQQHNKDNK